MTPADPHQPPSPSKYDDRPGGSDRQFGLVFAAFFAAVALWPWVSGGSLRLWPLPLALGFGLVAGLAPRALGPLNAVWTRFGLVLNAVVSPIVLAVIFFVGFVPIGLVLRALGRRPLPLKRDPSAPSYWVVREPPGPPPETMTQQF